MEAFAAYKIIYDRPIIIEYYKGAITVEHLVALKQSILKEPDYDFYSATILDLRDCVLKVDSEGFIRVNEFFKSNFQETETRKVAYLTSKPNEVVVSTLFSKYCNREGFNFNTNIFSTLGATARWFGESTISETELDDCIAELKTMPNIFTK